MDVAPLIAVGVIHIDGGNWLSYLFGTYISLFSSLSLSLFPVHFLSFSFSFSFSFFLFITYIFLQIGDIVGYQEWLFHSPCVGRCCALGGFWTSGFADSSYQETRRGGLFFRRGKCFTTPKATTQLTLLFTLFFKGSCPHNSTTGDILEHDKPAPFSPFLLSMGVVYY